MTKKQYTAIFITIGIFIIIIASILINGTKKNNLFSKIIQSESYTITMKDCNGREVTLPNEALQNIKDKWKNLSDNGPWTGDQNKCYKTITISYETNDVIEKLEIILVDDTSLSLILNNNNRYYTNSEEINKYLNNLFSMY